VALAGTDRYLKRIHEHARRDRRFFVRVRDDIPIPAVNQAFMVQVNAAIDHDAIEQYLTPMKVKKYKIELA
jgi:hypothetical protein